MAPANLLLQVGIFRTMKLLHLFWARHLDTSEGNLQLKTIKTASEPINVQGMNLTKYIYTLCHELRAHYNLQIILSKTNLFENLLTDTFMYLNHFDNNKVNKIILYSWGFCTAKIKLSMTKCEMYLWFMVIFSHGHFSSFPFQCKLFFPTSSDSAHAQLLWTDSTN